MDWQKRVTQEKDLGEVYRRARRIGSTWENFGVAVLVGLLLGLLAIADWRYSLEMLPLNALRTLLGQIADIGFALTTAILGFLIAGFSIFASITRPKIFVGLAMLDHEDTGISRLQFIFFNFLLVFIHYLAFLGVSIVLKIGLPLAPTVVKLIDEGFPSAEMTVWWISVALCALLLGWLGFLVMLLKSFIWNIYQAILVVIVTGDEIVELEKVLSGAGGSASK